MIDYQDYQLLKDHFNIYDRFMCMNDSLQFDYLSLFQNMKSY